MDVAGMDANRALEKGYLHDAINDMHLGGRIVLPPASSGDCVCLWLPSWSRLLASCPFHDGYSYPYRPDMGWRTVDADAHGIVYTHLKTPEAKRQRAEGAKLRQARVKRQRQREGVAQSLQDPLLPGPQVSALGAASASILDRRVERR